MIYDGINMDPCVGSGTCNIQLRTLIGECNGTGGTIAGSNNMLSWMTAYNEAGSMSTIPWGNSRLATFNTSASTAPDTLVDNTFPPPVYSATALYADPGGGVASSESQAYITQVSLGGPRNWLILAVGFEQPSGDAISVAGCTFVVSGNPICNPNVLVNLPIPDPSLGYHCQSYIFAVVGPNPSGTATDQYTSLAQMADVLCPNYGTAWDATRICFMGSESPFHL